MLAECLNKKKRCFVTSLPLTVPFSFSIYKDSSHYGNQSLSLEGENSEQIISVDDPSKVTGKIEDHRLPVTLTLFQDRFNYTTFIASCRTTILHMFGVPTRRVC